MKRKHTPAEPTVHRPCRFCNRLLGEIAASNGLGTLLDAGIRRTYAIGPVCLRCARQRTATAAGRVAVRRLADEADAVRRWPTAVRLLGAIPPHPPRS